MCNCKELEHKVNVGEKILQSMGAPVYTYYQVHAAKPKDNSWFYSGVFVLIIFIAYMYFTSGKTEQPSKINQPEYITNTTIEK